MRRVAVNVLSLVIITAGALMLDARPASAVGEDDPLVLNPDIGGGGGGGFTSYACCKGPTCDCCGVNFAICSPTSCWCR